MALIGGLSSCMPDDDAIAITDRSHAIGSPRFEVSLRQKTLHLAGHAASTEHRQRLRQVAQNSFPLLETSTDFKPPGTLPESWTETTQRLLVTLSAARSANAHLTDTVLSIRGVASNEWQGQLEALRSTLPEAVRLEVDVLVPDITKNVRDLCARAFAAQQPGPINFEESQTVLRSSAYSVLERIITLAHECRDSTVSITGHTDSSGDETWNRHLSLMRARAVADQFALRGITRNRLTVDGAGSSSPIADNRNRYGRGINRRIEIVLRQTRGTEED